MMRKSLVFHYNSVQHAIVAFTTICFTIIVNNDFQIRNHHGCVVNAFVPTTTGIIVSKPKCTTTTSIKFENNNNKYRNIIYNNKNDKNIMFQNAITTFVTIANRQWMLYATTESSSIITTDLDDTTIDNNNMTTTISSVSTTTLTHDGIIELATKNNYFINEEGIDQQEQSTLLKEEDDDNNNDINNVAALSIIESSSSSSSNNNNIITEVKAADIECVIDSPIPMEDLERVLLEMEREADIVANELMDENCEVDPETGKPLDPEICSDDVARIGFRKTVKGYVNQCLQMVRGTSVKDVDVFTMDTDDDDDDEVPEGELLERGWEQRAASSALRRNAEVWKFALKSVFRVLKPRRMKTKGIATDEEIRLAQIEAATFIRDGLLRLGPSFVKLGQVISTRTDVLPTTYTDILRTLTDEVPGFSGKRAKEIVTKELGISCDKIFSKFSSKPLKAASLGQVHTAFYKGQKVAIKVQRAGLKELFDTDLKNLKKLAVLLEKFDPKSDGADRDWIKIYEESERLLYLEIDYINEAQNTIRFANDFKNVNYVKIPNVYTDISTSRVLVMEYVESIKMTDIKAVEKAGLDRKLLSKRVADTFLRQIIETSYFHCDPHSGNLCCNKEGQLVFYDFGQMDELKPNVREGLRTFCTALFKGGPMISDAQLATNAKELVKGVEQAGVLSKNADRFSVEKLARYFMRTFKDNQLGKKGTNIKETLGADLQTLTENNSFRFPATFTFVFRAFVSIEGIGKELDSEFDLGKLAQPFIQKFIDTQKGYTSPVEKNLDIFSRVTGLNIPDINIAVSQPKKVAYIEETIRSMESGNLKIRVRSLENEKALERINLRYDVFQNMLIASIILNITNIIKLYNPIIRIASVSVATIFILQSVIANTKIKSFDKKQAKYINTDFVEAPITNDDATKTVESTKS